jgi:hypothetical protein
MVAEASGDRIQNGDGLRDDFGTDPITRQDCDPRVHDFNIPAWRA